MGKSILFIINAPWSDRLGLSRVSIRIFEHLREIGWHCDYLCLDKPFFKHAMLNRCFKNYFIQREVLRHIRKHGHRYTAIQVEHNLLRYSRSMYNYSGKLIAKSNGLDLVYRKYLKEFKVYSPPRTHHKFIHFLNDISSGGIKAINNAFIQSDQIHVLSNYEEKFISMLGYEEKTHVISNGLSDSESADLLLEFSVDKKFVSNLIVTIGTWCPRKGSNEWPRLVRALRSANPNLCFRFLGTGESSHRVLSNFNSEDKSFIDVVPSFEVQNLALLLSDAKLGVFISYVEGFGIGLLEMLASGTPVISWDVPGPREMYQHGLRRLMVSPGNIKKTQEIIIQCIQNKKNEYEKICLDAINISKKFKWSCIAKKLDTILSSK
jgi:glycosyltransferase involved in cell wall biosynthesis